MGFAVLNIKKPKGNDARTTAHIERTVNPGNADQNRTRLNEKLIEYPEGVENRTQAIQHRIKSAGITRKIRDNQVRALQVILSGTHEDMKRIQSAGKLDEWCKDNIEWLQDTFGKENVVSAILHMDEKTPHIHATVVPIVKGERRKAEAEKNNGKKKYRKKPKDNVRLCADDEMTRDNLERFQDTYAEKMQKYGLERGIRGSEARHIDTTQFYKMVYTENQLLKEENKELVQEHQDIHNSVRSLYDMKDEAREKFLDMDNYVKKREKDVANVEAYLDELKKGYEPYKAQDDLNLLFSVFPHLSERLRIAQLCKVTGLKIDTIKRLFNGEAVTVTGKLYSPEHKQDFNVQDAKLQLFKESKDSDKLKLSINGQNIIDWFKQKYQALKQAIKPHIKPIQPEQKKGRGI